MIGELSIRVCQEKDLAAVARLMEEAFGADASLPLNPLYLSDPNIYCHIIEMDGQIVATAALHILQKINRKLGQIEDVVVSGDRRGLGLGKKIVEHLIEQSKAEGCYKTILNATDENIPFYAKMDFRVEQNQLVIRH